MPRLPRPQRLRPIGFDDRLSVVDHLDELRNRLIVAGAFLVVVFAVCFWQNHRLLDIVNHPLSKVHGSPDQLQSVTSHEVKERKGLSIARKGITALQGSTTQSAADRANFAVVERGLTKAIRALPTKTLHDKPLTIGIGEPFTTTITVVFGFTLLITLPMLLYQIYAFVIPALSPREAKVAKPIVIISPLLFAAGVVFTYFLVLPPAVEFLQGYNNTQFQSLVQASSFYKFEMLTMGAIGLAFEVPLILLALQRAGIVNGHTLTGGGRWRYGILVIAVIVAALPGVDPVTMFFEMLPLLVLFAVSIVMLKIADRRDAKAAAREEILRSGDGTGQT